MEIEELILFQILKCLFTTSFYYLKAIMMNASSVFEASLTISFVQIWGLNQPSKLFVLVVFLWLARYLNGARLA
jgi:hypothetical protein